MSEKRDMRRSEKLQAGCGCSVLIGLFVLAGVHSMSSGMCETTTYLETTSPSGGVEARVQMTDCGATTGFSRVVWMQPAWLPRDRVLSCRAVALDNQPNVTLSWSRDALVVATDAPPSDVINSADSCYGWPIELKHAALEHGLDSSEAKKSAGARGESDAGGLRLDP
jgi:hypothetical protein